MIIINGVDCPEAELTMFLLAKEPPTGFRYWNRENVTDFYTCCALADMDMKKVLAGEKRDEDLRPLRLKIEYYYR